MAAALQIDTNWSIPFDSSIPAVYSAMNLLRKGIPCEKLMSAYLIRWQEAGYIIIEERKNECKKVRPKTEESIVFSPKKTLEQGVEQMLFKILTDSADQDGVLWASEMEKMAEKLYTRLTEWAKAVKSEGEQELIRSGAAAANINGIIQFTVSGFDQAVRMMGFQKYLMEMRGQGENRTAPRELWGDYLVFAALFGIGEQVLESMKALDPGYFDTFAGMYGCNAYSIMYFMTMTNHISSASAPNTPNTDGTGGAASSASGGGGGGSR